VHGAERGHGTARERGESGAEGSSTGKKKERRREMLTSGPHLSERESECERQWAESWAAGLVWFFFLFSFLLFFFKLNSN